MSRSKALVTGASSGIGATYADRLARRGADLILVARNGARLEQVAGKLRQASGTTVETMVADLTLPADLARVEQRLREDLDISMLVNNAGMAGGGPLAQAHPDELETMIRLNVTSLTRLAAAAAAQFAAKGAGTIINIGSVVALMPEALAPVYPATKAFVLALSQSLGAELAGRGVRVQAVLPGATRTEIWERAGLDVDALPREMVMDVDELVDAALAGLDMGEHITIPSLPSSDDWEAFEAARARLQPNLSLAHAAARYGGAPVSS